jgi:hypothetical protein
MHSTPTTAPSTKTLHSPTSPADLSLDQRLNDFMQLSQSLLAIIGLENSILLEDGEFTFETYIQKKVDLMRQFENQAQNLLHDMIDGGAGQTRTAVLMEEVKRIRNVLTVNSSFQLDQIRNRTKARQERFAVRGGDTCH